MKLNAARLRVLPIFISSVALLAYPARGQAETYNILVTNDDGIESPGIQMLAERLGEVGRVHVVAPCGQRSGASMSVALRDEIHLKSIKRDGKQLQHCVDTTPAGAVMLAITSLAPQGGFDLVISGINDGANVGIAAHMSGTVEAAMMGALYDLPAIAVSLGARGGDFDYSARFVTSFVEELKRRPAMPGIVFSINIPRATEEEITGVTVAKMGGSRLSFAYAEIEGAGEDRRFSPRIGLRADSPERSDSEAFKSGKITITPLLFDWTAYAKLEQIGGWGLTRSPVRRGHHAEESISAF